MDGLQGDNPSIGTAQREVWSNLVRLEVVRLERAIAGALESRIQLEFTAIGLMRVANEREQIQLREIATHGRKAKRQKFLDMRRAVGAVVTRRILRSSEGSSAVPLSAETRRLADALKTQLESSETPLRPDNLGQNAQVFQLISDLATLGTEGETLRLRAHDLLLESSESTLSIKLDSLSLDASELRAHQKHKRETQEKIEQAFDSLAPFDDPSSEAIRVRLTAVHLNDANAVRVILEETAVHTDALARQLDGQRARDAIVEGLTALGYEVQVQEASWQPGRRIAARKPNEPNYDVQLAAASDGRIQSKVRAFDHPARSNGFNARDVEVETAWCSDLKLLNTRMQDIGIDTMLEHEDAPGSGEAILAQRSEHAHGAVPERSVTNKKLERPV